MKIIHCSDLHLDSKMTSNLDSKKAKERRDEILLTFQKLVRYAKEQKVKVILIAGDMFDKNKITVKAKNIVKDAILNAKDIDFLYLKGNHDEASFIGEDEEIPENLKMFSKEKWISYKYDIDDKKENEIHQRKINITGIEFGGISDSQIYNSLILDKNDINIVCMHGQESIYDGKDKTEIINLQNLKNKNIDYLALGHIHKYKEQKLDSRGIYCYSGCLEGRGFDECNEKGFVLLEIKNNEISRTFIPFAKRTLHEVKVDVTGTNTTNEAIEKIQQYLREISKSDLIKIILTGRVELESERDIDFILRKYQEEFYFVKVYDETSPIIDYSKYEYDASLKGEFIRLILAEKITDKEKQEIIMTGLKALSGEELD